MCAAILTGILTIDLGFNSMKNAKDLLQSLRGNEASQKDKVTHTPSHSLTTVQLPSQWKPKGEQTETTSITVAHSQDPTTTTAPQELSDAPATVIILPFRNRPVQLRKFLDAMCEFWKPEVNPLYIYSIEQGDDNPFNRGWLLNIGIKTWLSTGKTGECLFVHDVDLLPDASPNRVSYHQCVWPRHMSSEQENFGWTTPYDTFFGGVVGMSIDHWIKINGMSNDFLGWGGEDDELLARVRQYGLFNTEYFRAPRGFGRFSHEKEDHFRKPKNEAEYQHNLQILYHRKKPFNQDGISNVKYQVTKVEPDGKNICNNVVFSNVNVVGSPTMYNV